MTYQARAEAVVLGGDTYVVRNNVVQIESVDAWAEPIRIVGNKRRGDRRNAAQWVKEFWASGLGFYVAEGDPDAEQPHPSQNGFFNSAVETRFNGQVTLPILEEALTHENDGQDTNPDHDYYRFVPFGPDLFAISRSATQSIAIYDPSAGDDWDESLDMTSGYTSHTSRSYVSHNGDLYVFGGTLTAAAGNHATWDGSTWSAFTPTTNFSGGSPWSVVSFKDVMYAVIYDPTNGLIKISSSTDNGDNWADVAGMERTLRSPSNRPGALQLIEYYDASGDPAIFLHWNEGLDLLDFANSDLLPVLRLDPLNLTTVGAFDGHDQAKVWNGRLYLPRRQNLIEFRYDGVWRDISPWTQGRVPASLRGSASSAPAIIECMATSGSWLFIGLSTVVGTNSIWAYDGQGFHYMWSRSFTGTGRGLRDIIVQFDTKVNIRWDLHILVSDDSDSAQFYVLKHPLDNPLENDQIKFGSSGTLITPWFDGGMTEVDSAILAVGMGANDLDTTANDNEKIQVEVALNYSETYESDPFEVKTFYSDSNAVQTYIDTTNGQMGLSGRTWRARYTLTRGSTNTNTPVMFYPVFYYEKLFTDLHRYTFEVDVKKTLQDGRSQGFGQPQDILQALEDLKSTVPLSAFSFAGSEVHSGGATRYVRIVNNPYVQRLPQSGGSVGSYDPKADEAFIPVSLEERI